MDRPIVYPGQIARALDFLNTNRNVMTAMGAAMQAVIGTTTQIDGLACTPTSPASMQVTVGPGSIYALANLDGTDYSSLVADTTHSIVKQGIRLDASNFNCPAPATTGQSVVYLIQAAFTETDSVPVTLPYYNSSNPPTPYSGPGGLGAAQNTVRKGICTVSIKTGVAATTGTQAAPAVDPGYTALYAITVANGATSITSGNIAAIAGAPFLTDKLKDKSASPALPAVIRIWRALGIRSFPAALSSNGDFRQRFRVQTARQLSHFRSFFRMLACSPSRRRITLRQVRLAS